MRGPSPSAARFGGASEGSCSPHALRAEAVRATAVGGGAGGAGSAGGAAGGAGSGGDGGVDEDAQLALAIKQSLSEEAARAAAERQHERAALRGFIESLEDVSARPPAAPPHAGGCGCACGCEVAAGGAGCTSAGGAVAEAEGGRRAAECVYSPAAVRHTGRLMALQLLQEHVASGEGI
eukprot:6108910-Prymnesium_polylepis.1